MFFSIQRQERFFNTQKKRELSPRFFVHLSLMDRYRFR